MQRQHNALGTLFWSAGTALWKPVKTQSYFPLFLKKNLIEGLVFFFFLTKLGGEK